MRYWFDTEFIEDGKTIDLISIGIVCEDGQKIYLQNKDCDLNKASDWVRGNVFPHLSEGFWYPKTTLARIILGFIEGENPEIWAYYSDYDWVAFCQLFGRMIDLPHRFPKFCLDVKQLAVSKGNPKLPEQKTAEHHALADAEWTKEAWEFLQGIK